MKYIKILGFAAVAAAALMAFVGASTASATVLCQVPGTGLVTGTTCPSGQAHPALTAIHAINVGNVTLTTTFKNIECNKSTIKGGIANEGNEGERVGALVEMLTFEECNCEVKALNKGTLEFEWSPFTHNGTVFSRGAEVTAECSTIFGKVHCIYSTGLGTDVGTLTGGAEATWDIEANSLIRVNTSAACSEVARWDAHYKVTSPNPLYVTGET